MIAERRNQMHVAYLAYYDAVTGLPNRVLFLDRFEQALERARRDKDFIALLYLDLGRLQADQRQHGARRR